MIRYPNIIGKTDAQKLEQMKSYLHQLADELNYQLDKSGNLMSGFPSTANEMAKPIKKDNAISNFNDIKALIIKSADIVDAYYEEINKKLEGQYVAESDFGTYKEETQAQLSASSDQVKVVLEKQEEIETDLGDVERELRSEIKQQADSISMTVENGESTAQIMLKVGDREIPATINMNGLVTFSNLANADGTTVINGSNITTGQILADLIKAGIIKSKDKHGVVIDLDKGVSSLARGTAASFNDYNGEDVEDEIKEFLIEEASIMQNETIKDYAIKVDAANFADGANVQIHKFTNTDGMNSISATLFWTDGKINHWQANEESMDFWYWVNPSETVNKEYVDGLLVADSTYPSCYKRTVNGVVEWLNPPMKPGEEYRTTERWNGKPVYAWLIDAGALPNAKTKTVYFSNSSSTVGEVISCEGSTSGGMSLPHVVASTAASVYLDNGRGYVNIITGVDRSASTAKIMVKYTKTTD